MNRYRVYLTSCPEPGAKIVVDPGVVVERWTAEAGLARPERWSNDEPLVGYVVHVYGQVAGTVFGLPTNDERAGLWNVAIEDPPPFEATVGAILTVALGPVLAPGAEIIALLDWAANRPDDAEPLTDVQYAAVADGLRRHFVSLDYTGHLPKRLEDAIEWIGTNLPRFETPGEYAAWVEGVAVATGCHYGVSLDPSPCIPVPEPPEPEPPRITDLDTRPMTMRPDVLDQIAKHRGLN